MSVVTIIWSVVASGALLLAIMYGLVWVMDRKARASLAFAFECLAIVGAVVVELGMMYSTTSEEWGEWLRWAQLPIFLRVAALVAFIRFYFGTGRTWLAWTIIVGRAIVLIVGFAIDPNFNFARIDSIDRIPFLGEQVTVVGQALVSPHQWFATTITGLVLVFVVDASIALWRRGTADARRKVIVIGGAVFVSWAIVISTSQLMVLSNVQLPALLSPPNLILLAAMTFELSRDTLRASRLARELQESEARLQLAASAAGFGLCIWDVERKRIWATEAAREMVGLEEHEPIEVDRLQRMMHPDDIESLRSVLRAATASGDEHEVHFRILRPDGSARWISALGRSEPDARGRMLLIRGVLRDVTEQFRARQQVEDLQRELAHAGRVSVLGTLSSSLAHELSQPLSAIMLNTRTAAMMLDKPDADLEELRQILDDIQRDDRRAAEVIDRLRSLLKRRNLDFAPVSVEGLLSETSALLKSDAIARDVTLEFTSDAGVPMVHGDKVHLSQVLINLIINGMDAVADRPAGSRHVSIRGYLAQAGWVELEIRDSGGGIPSDAIERIFEPFYTTKAAGMGMGLSVSRTIVEAHGGSLWAENGPDGGAILRVRLPAVE
jgi:PAS domain S-box-containing protein